MKYYGRYRTTKRGFNYYVEISQDQYNTLAKYRDEEADNEVTIPNEIQSLVDEIIKGEGLNSTTDYAAVIFLPGT